jgi:hypothetical protein
MKELVMAGRSRILFAIVAAAGVLAAAPLAAHHSAAAAYDETKKVEAQGTVKRVLVKNPHSWVFLEGTDEKGQTIEWQIEMGGVTSMAWTKEALPIGAAVKAVGHPSRAPGSHGMTAAVFSKADGTPIGPRGGRGETPPR